MHKPAAPKRAVHDPYPPWLTIGEAMLADDLDRMAETQPAEAATWRERAQKVRQAHRMLPRPRAALLEEARAVLPDKVATE